MNSNQPKNLTQKQKELVKRLESIRNTKDGSARNSNKTEDTRGSVTSQRRNERTKQNRPVAKSSGETIARKRERTASQKKFTRPVVESPIKVEPRKKYQPNTVQPKKRVQQRKKEIVIKQKKEHYINQLSNGKQLSQAIVLSEILNKPLALRKR